MSKTLYNPGKFNITYEEMTFNFKSELDRFIEIFNSQDMQKILKLYQSDKQKLFKSDLIKIPSKYLKSGVISLNKTKDKNIIRALAYSQIATTCQLFDEKNIPIAYIKPNHSASITQSLIDNTIQQLGDNAIKNFMGDIHIADSVRIISLLRILGLLKLNKNTCQQLSLGCYSGIRDLNAIHSTQQVVESALPQPSISFKSTFAQAKHTILIDPAEPVIELYTSLNKNSPDSILAINDYAEPALIDIAKKIQDNEIEKRTLIISQIDHRMIPDASIFFDHLAQTIDDTADLVMSYGAGDTPDQFQGRVHAFDEIEQHLKSLGMSPIRIRMHNDNGTSIINHRQNPLFGLLQTASHEILYCKLKRKLLLKNN